MDILTLLEFLLLTLMCGALVNYYSAPSVSFIVKLVSTFTWVLNFGLLLLVPDDLYFTLKTTRNDGMGGLSPEDLKLPQAQQLSTQYAWLYWSVYLLTWTIIPVLQEWENSGDFDSSKRLKRSLKTNGVFYLYMLVGAILSLVVLILIDAAGDMGLITYLKCLASAFGIFLLMILMGYAMVEIPRAHWRTTNLVTEVRYLHSKVSEAEQEKMLANEELEEVVCQLFKLKQSTESFAASNSSSEGNLFREYIDYSLLQVPEEIRNKLSRSFNVKIKELKIYQYPAEMDSAVELHRLTKRALALKKRIQGDYQNFISRALFAEDVLAAAEGKSDVQFPPFLGIDGRTFHTSIKPKFKKLVACIFGLGSAILLICETQVFMGSKQSVLSYIIKIDSLQLIRIVCLLVIAYIAYMVYYSLFRLKFSNLYGLYHKNSDGPSLMFATINFSRVAAPLAVNFFDMVRVSGVFTHSMGGNNLGLLGNWVIKGMPGVLWLIALMHYFDGWSKLMGLVGLQEWGFKAWDGQDSVVSVLKSRRKQIQAQKKVSAQP